MNINGKTKFILFCGAIVTILALIPKPEPLPAAPPAPAKPDTAVDLSACKIVREFVIDRLKAPAGAEFQPCWGGLFGQNGKDHAIVYPSRGGAGTVFSVVAYVDAQNGFGAKLRNYYQAKVLYTGSNWRLQSLTFDKP